MKITEITPDEYYKLVGRKPPQLYHLPIVLFRAIKRIKRLSKEKES